MNALSEINGTPFCKCGPSGKKHAQQERMSDAQGVFSSTDFTNSSFVFPLFVFSCMYCIYCAVLCLSSVRNVYT